MEFRQTNKNGGDVVNQFDKVPATALLAYALHKAKESQSVYTPEERQQLAAAWERELLR